jgi:hypothetical protein
VNRCLPLGEQLSEDVCYHVLSRTVSGGDGVLCDGVSNEMIADVDVFCLGVVVVVGGQLES